MNLKVSLLFRSYLGLTRGDQLLFCAGKHVHHCCYWVDSAASFPCQRRMLCADFAEPCSKMRFCSQHCVLPLRVWNQALPTVLASSLLSGELCDKTYVTCHCENKRLLSTNHVETSGFTMVYMSKSMATVWHVLQNPVNRYSELLKLITLSQYRLCDP